MDSCNHAISPTELIKGSILIPGPTAGITDFLIIRFASLGLYKQLSIIVSAIDLIVPVTKGLLIKYSLDAVVLSVPLHKLS